MYRYEFTSYEVLGVKAMGRDGLTSYGMIGVKAMGRDGHTSYVMIGLRQWVEMSSHHMR